MDGGEQAEGEEEQLSIPFELQKLFINLQASAETSLQHGDRCVPYTCPFQYHVDKT